MSEPYDPIDHEAVLDLALTLAKHLTKISKANAQAACICAAVMCSLEAERFGPEGELLDDMADMASEAIKLIAERFPSMSGTAH
jgi:methionine synthase II (cobalamin-independent)